MKFLFVFVLFLGATSTFSLKQTVNNEKDCKILSEHMHKMFKPHLIARGMDPLQADKILQDHTDCVPLSGVGSENTGNNDNKQQEN